jgi:hypothetical protein
MAKLLRVRTQPFADWMRPAIFSAQSPLLHKAFHGTLFGMGSKDKGRKEAKKAPKPKPKPEPGRKREIFTPPPPPK